MRANEEIHAKIKAETEDDRQDDRCSGKNGFFRNAKGKVRFNGHVDQELMLYEWLEWSGEESHAEGLEEGANRAIRFIEDNKNDSVDEMLKKLRIDRVGWRPHGKVL